MTLVAETRPRLVAKREQARAEAAETVWREQPATFETFVGSREHLGLPRLYDRQMRFVGRLLGDDPRMVFEDPFELAKRKRRACQLAVALWGKGSGKDYICSIIVAYCVHVLLCLRDPQAYLELAPNEAIDIVNVAYNADQAKRVFFAKLQARVEAWPWLSERCNITVGGRRVNGYEPDRGECRINDGFIEFPRMIRAWSRHAQNESYEGLNILVWLMDEASAFLSTIKKENATAIYNTLKSSATSRYSRRWLGMVISYPRHQDDFTMSLLRRAKNEPNLAIYGDGPAKTWEVNERTAREPRVRVRDVEVPSSLVPEFEEDFQEALSRYCCEPPAAKEAFFRFPHHLDEAVRTGVAPLIEWEPTVVSRELGDGSRRRLRGVRLLRCDPLPAGAKLYAHGDPGLSNDSYALALAYAVPATIMVTVPAGEVLDQVRLDAEGLEPTDPVEWERDVIRTVVVGLLVWRPDPREDIQVDLQNVKDVLLELRKAYPSLGHWPAKRKDEPKRRPTVTTDHWNAAQIMQELQSKRWAVKDEAWTRDFQVEIYRNGRTCLYQSLVDLPDTPSITSTDPREPGALYELKRVEFIEGQKVDHPEGGSKDLGDAVIRVIQHACEHNTGPSMGFGKAMGHRSEYRGTGPMVPSETKKVDPKRTRTIGDMLREQGAQSEESARSERPLGELVPGEGTVDGRRMGFASVNNGPGRR